MRNGATITLGNGTVRGVKNLGWLLRRWREVQSFAVTPADPVTENECILVARMHSNSNVKEYRIAFGSADVLWLWLQRSIFYGLPLSWFGYSTTIVRRMPMPKM